jgi:hypothetical protein
MPTFKPGQSVVVNADVRPARFAGKTGTVVEVGEELGVRLGSERSHTSLTWFLPKELSPLEVGQSPHAARQRSVRAPRGAKAPTPAKSVDEGSVARCLMIY